MSVRIHVDDDLLTRLGPEARARIERELDPALEFHKARRGPRITTGSAALPESPAPGRAFSWRSISPYLSRTVLARQRVPLSWLAVLALASAGVILGLIWSVPAVVPDGWHLEPSLPARVAAVLTAHLPRWAAALLALAGGGAAARWGGRWLLLAARIGIALLAVAVAWAAARG
jgi:hypothetical protein